MNDKLSKETIVFFLCISFMACASPQKDWEQAEDIGTKDAYEQFLQKHPNSQFEDEASKMLENLDWSETTQQDTISAYEKFLTHYKESIHSEKAQQRIKVLQAECSQLLKESESLIKRKQENLAIEKYQRVVNQCEGTTNAAYAHFYLAKTYSQKKDHVNGPQEFNLSIENGADENLLFDIGVNCGEMFLLSGFNKKYNTIAVAAFEKYLLVSTNPEKKQIAKNMLINLKKSTGQK